MTEIKDHIKGYATLIYYRENALWYKTESNLIFPVPIDDAGFTQFNPSEKAIHLMRWIRKYLAGIV